MIKGKFIDNLPKVYGIYTGGFLVFIILMAIAESAGMSAKMIGLGPYASLASTRRGRKRVKSVGFHPLHECCLTQNWATL